MQLDLGKLEGREARESHSHTPVLITTLARRSLLHPAVALPLVAHRRARRLQRHRVRVGRRVPVKLPSPPPARQTWAAYVRDDWGRSASRKYTGDEGVDVGRQKNWGRYGICCSEKSLIFSRK